MNYSFPKVKLNKEGLFGPTDKNHFYQPVGYHNPTAKKNKDKTRWKLNKGEQYEVFRLSDEGQWNCKSNNGLFSILANGDVIMGTSEERLAFFPGPPNLNDAWHGYPVNSGEYEPSTALVDHWLEKKIIDQRIHIKILRGDL